MKHKKNYEKNDRYDEDDDDYNEGKNKHRRRPPKDFKRLWEMHQDDYEDVADEEFYS